MREIEAKNGNRRVVNADTAEWIDGGGNITTTLEWNGHIYTYSRFDDCFVY
jgi:hypothetical protein